jgi:hypothetical protein
MKNDCLRMLQQLTGKSKIYFTERGNASIHHSLRFAWGLGKRRLIMQDQGVWLKYHPIAKEIGYRIVTAKTKLGLYDPKFFPNLDEECVVLWNSAPGYYTFDEQMAELGSLCQAENALLINDISGSIGQPCSKIGDLTLGSFGRWKPVWLEQGGFLASDSQIPIEEYKIDDEFYSNLKGKLEALSNRIDFLLKRSAVIKKELDKHDIISGNGFNVLVKFNNEKEKQDLITYCDANNLQYTFCPREIRVLEQAISIEVKRLRE